MHQISRNDIATSVVEIVEADLSCHERAQAVEFLIDAYARDPMGNGRPLSDEVRRDLVPGLRQHPTTLVLLAYCGAQAAGIAVCFRGFSTFAARPLLNIHDLAVLREYRGRGIGRHLLDAVAEKARSLGCCKLTLEVLENNHGARRLYAAAGFAQAAYEEAAGGAPFYAKPL
jgi:ribosomal protein S18 acetylase RimI-like enzyme